jgi:hypothetical protein
VTYTYTHQVSDGLPSAVIKATNIVAATLSSNSAAQLPRGDVHSQARNRRQGMALKAPLELRDCHRASMVRSSTL